MSTGGNSRGESGSAERAEACLRSDLDLGLEGSGFWQRRGVLSHGKASARKRGGGQADLSVQSPVGTPQVRPSGAEIYGGARYGI